MTEEPWPYGLPIWRRFHRAASPDGLRVAQVDPAYEVSMGNPTSGMLCVTGGPHLARCSPSFVWSDDSRYLAVPQFIDRWGLVRRQRMLILAFDERRVFASRDTAWYFQPESFSSGRLLVKKNPLGSARTVSFDLPGDLAARFFYEFAPWPEGTETPVRS